jgi:hypothetical protein
LLAIDINERSQLGNSASFAIAFVEANRLLVACGVLEQDLPWPDSDTEDFEELKFQFNYVIKKLKQQKQHQKITLDYGIDPTKLVTPFQDIILENGKIGSVVKIGLGLLIQKEVRFKEVITLRGPDVSFWSDGIDLEVNSLLDAVQKVGNQMITVRLKHPKARIDYVVFDEPDWQ